MEPQAQANVPAGIPSGPLAAFGLSCFSPSWPTGLLEGKSKTLTECRPSTSPARTDSCAWAVSSDLEMSQLGGNVWKVCDGNLVYMMEHVHKGFQKLWERIQDLNCQQKNMQLTAGCNLREMESLGIPGQ